MKSAKRKHKTIHHFIIGLAALWLSPTLQAAPTTQQATLPTLFVTADRVANDAAQISADTTVIGREEIEQSQKSSVADLLRDQAGIHVAATGGPGKATSVFIRGANSGQTLVLIDGVRVGSVTLGSFDWANLSTADVERIEIVRGPQSSLYGADAMGGVIQIFTRKGKMGSHITAHAEAGSYSTASASSTVSGGSDGGAHYAITANSMRTDSVSAAAKGAENDPYRQTTVSGRLTLPVGEGEVELLARNVDGKTSLDGFPAPSFTLADVLNFTSDTRQSVMSARISYPLTDYLDSTLQLSRSLDEVTGHDPAGGFNNSDFRTRINQITWQNHLDLDALSLLVGLDIHQDKGNSGSAGFARSLTQKAGFASLAWHADWLDLNGAVRYDSNSASNNKTTYKAGLAVHPMGGVKISANYGTGFKAPSINDLYFPASAFSGGNPNLRPETSRSWDVGLYYQYRGDGSDAAFSAVWFDQRFHDLIVWQSDPVTFFSSPVNIGRASTRGLELSGRIHVGFAYLQGMYTFLNARDTISNALLPRRARDKGSITVGVNLAGLNTEVSWLVVGPRFSSTGNRKPMRGYRKTDVRVSYAVNKQWKLTARVDNLNNKTYEEVSGYGVLGRAWYGGVSASF